MPRTSTKTNKKTELKLDLLIDVVKDLKSEIQELRRDQGKYSQALEKMREENYLLKKKKQKVSNNNNGVNTTLPIDTNDPKILKQTIGNMYSTNRNTGKSGI